MRLRALIVAPPTIDYIYEEGKLASVSPGGPALYSGLALISRFNAKVYAVGPVGYLSMYTTIVENAVGIERLGYSHPGVGAVFELDYRGDSRRVVAKSRIPAIDIDVVAEVASKVHPDMILLSPIQGEESGVIHGLLYSSYSRCLGIDIQGYARGNVEVAEHVITSNYTVLHASIDDIDFRRVFNRASSGIIIYTRGIGPITILDRRIGVEIEPDIDVVLSESTGAGDVFTALTLAYICMGYDTIESVRMSSKETSRLLIAIRRSVESYKPLLESSINSMEI
ncbi:MAG: hypothetical protein GSR85_09870 [Desulfurococcales archaeon]|nr:hypothetical protein [Desulfurococcales archaeon]